MSANDCAWLSNWFNEECFCPDEGDRKVLDYAETEFTDQEYAYHSYAWFKYYSTKDQKWIINCSVVVRESLTRFGYHHLDLRLLKDPYWRYESEYFCPVPYDEAEPGDIIVFDSTDGGSDHVAIIAADPVFHEGKRWLFEVFEAHPTHIGRGLWDCDPDGYFDSHGYNFITTVWRPKVCYSEECTFPSKDDSAAKATILDPLVVYLEDSLTRTVGPEMEIYLDHDGDGLKELTGWVAPGAGILMVDINGNGLLDDGSELLGDSTILANGTRAADGFQALAQYDTNQDGKINFNDSIWTRLKIWQYGDFEFAGFADSSCKSPPDGGT